MRQNARAGKVPWCVLILSSSCILSICPGAPSLAADKVSQRPWYFTADPVRHDLTYPGTGKLPVSESVKEPVFKNVIFKTAIRVSMSAEERSLETWPGVRCVKVYRSGDKDGPYDLALTVSGQQVESLFGEDGKGVYFIDTRIEPGKRYYYRAELSDGKQDVIFQSGYASCPAVKLPDVDVRLTDGRFDMVWDTVAYDLSNHLIEPKFVISNQMGTELARLDTSVTRYTFPLSIGNTIRFSPVFTLDARVMLDAWASHLGQYALPGRIGGKNLCRQLTQDMRAKCSWKEIERSMSSWMKEQYTGFSDKFGKNACFEAGPGGELWMTPQTVLSGVEPGRLQARSGDGYVELKWDPVEVEPDGRNPERSRRNRKECWLTEPELVLYRLRAEENVDPRMPPWQPSEFAAAAAEDLRGGREIFRCAPSETEYTDADAQNGTVYYYGLAVEGISRHELWYHDSGTHPCTVFRRIFSRPGNQPPTRTGALSSYAAVGYPRAGEQTRVAFLPVALDRSFVLRLRSGQVLRQAQDAQDRPDFHRSCDRLFTRLYKAFSDLKGICLVEREIAERLFDEGDMGGSGLADGSRAQELGKSLRADYVIEPGVEYENGRPLLVVWLWDMQTLERERLVSVDSELFDVDKAGEDVLLKFRQRMNAAPILSPAREKPGNALKSWPVSLAILNFKPLRETDEKILTAGTIESLLTVPLGNSRGIILVERDMISAVLRELGMGKAGLLGTAAGLKVSMIVGAELALCGSYHSTGDSMEVDARIIHVNTGAIVKNIQAAGSTGDLAGIEKQLVDGVFKALEIEPGPAGKEPADGSYAKSMEAAIYCARGERAENPEEALREYKRAAYLSPDSPHIYFAIAGVHGRLGDIDKEYTAVKRGMSLKSKAGGFLLPGDYARLASIERRRGNAPGAIESLKMAEEAIEKYPGGTHYHLHAPLFLSGIGAEYKALGRFSDAARVYVGMLKDTARWRAPAELVEIAVSNTLELLDEDLDLEAKKEICRAVSRGSAASYPHQSLKACQMLLEMEKEENRADVLLSASKIYCDSLDDCDSAKKMLREAVNGSGDMPSITRCLLELASIYCREGDVDRAISICDRLAREYGETEEGGTARKKLAALIEPQKSEEEAGRLRDGIRNLQQRSLQLVTASREEFERGHVEEGREFLGTATALDGLAGGKKRQLFESFPYTKTAAMVEVNDILNHSTAAEIPARTRQVLETHRGMPYFFEIDCSALLDRAMLSRGPFAPRPGRTVLEAMVFSEIRRREARLNGDSWSSIDNPPAYHKLRIGECYEQVKRFPEAREAYGAVVAGHPGTEYAKKAAERLEMLKGAGASGAVRSQELIRMTAVRERDNGKKAWKVSFTGVPWKLSGPSLSSIEAAGDVGVREIPMAILDTTAYRDLLFVRTSQGMLYAVRRGRVRWVFDTRQARFPAGGAPLDGSLEPYRPVILGNRLMIAVPEDAVIYAVDAGSGQVLWKFTSWRRFDEWKAEGGRVYVRYTGSESFREVNVETGTTGAGS